MNQTPEPPPAGSEPEPIRSPGWTLNRSRRSPAAMAAAAELLRPTDSDPAPGAATATGAGAVAALSQQNRRGARATTGRADRSSPERRWRKIFN